MKKKLLLVTLLTASTMVMAGNYSRSNNIVTDHDTGLQWQDTPYTSAEKAVYNSRTQQTGRVTKWNNAKAVCTNAGNGWRLATINELKTIVDTNYFNPAMDPIFQSALPLGFWSATPSTSTGSAQGIGFASGKVHNCGMSGPAKFIRCVRKGTGGSTPPPPPPPGDNNPPPPPPSGDNNPPTASAGPDKTVQVNNSVTISGSGNDTDGDIVSYRWTKNGSFHSNEQSFDFTPSGTRNKTFELTVTDNDGAKATNEMVLTVTSDPVPPSTGNTPPTADAGSAQTVQVNTPATLDGSKSIDSDGDIVAYQWKRKSDGKIWSNEMIFDFTPSGTRTKTFVLTVTDDEGAKGTDEMVLTVSKDPVDVVTPPPSTGNTPPTANAGSNKTVQVNHAITISGTASDSDGTIKKYEWKKQSNGQILSNSKTLNFTPSGTRTKTLVFTVTDNDGATASDMMVLTVTK